MIALTLCHCCPTKTPTRPTYTDVIGVEVDFHFVRFGRYDRRLEEGVGRRWIFIRVAAAVVHQGRPVPVGDSDKFITAVVDIRKSPNRKGGEFQPQYLSSVHNDVIYFVKFLGIVVRMVW